MDKDQDILDEIAELRNKLYVIEMEQKVNTTKLEKLERSQKEISIKLNKSKVNPNNEFGLVGCECNCSFD